MKFLLEEEDSVEVLKTYFRPTPDGHVGRYLADAIAVRQRQQPSEDAASSERAVRSLLQRDEEEQDFLEVYCGIIVRHLFLMQKAITFIRELIADKVNFRNNAGHVWRPIEDLLARAAAISRFFDASTQRKPTKEDRERREYRRNLLRLSLGVQEEKQFAENFAALVI